jgi:single-strand DNA-binding protein
MNRVFIMGNLTRDPSARRLPSGGTVGDLSVAATESYRNKDGETVESTCFVDVVVWNKQADVCETYLHKGSSVLVEGRLQLDEWTDKEGQKRSKLRVRADRVHFMDKAPKKTEKREAEAVPA